MSVTLLVDQQVPEKWVAVDFTSRECYEISSSYSVYEGDGVRNGAKITASQ